MFIFIFEVDFGNIPILIYIESFGFVVRNRPLFGMPRVLRGEVPRFMFLDMEAPFLELCIFNFIP